MDGNYQNIISSSRKQGNKYDALYISDDSEEDDIVSQEMAQSSVEEKKDINKEDKLKLEELENEEDWIPAKVKKETSKKKKNWNRQNKQNYDDKQVGLWYNEQSWQYKLVNDLYVFKDTKQSVLQKYDLMYVKKMYQKAKSNFRKNRAYYKMMHVVTMKEWDSIKDNIEEVAFRQSDLQFSSASEIDLSQ